MSRLLPGRRSSIWNLTPTTSAKNNISALSSSNWSRSTSAAPRKTAPEHAASGQSGPILSFLLAGNMTPLNHRWALVTGASPKSMGEAEVMEFLKRGVNVISTATDGQGVEYLKPEAGSKNGFLVKLRMDVTSQDSVNEAVEQVEKLVDGKLHYLLNNCESRYYTPLMDADIEKSKETYDVNVWGILRVTQAFFPLLRAAKGMVVNQAGVAGLQGYNRPFMGMYPSSKAAVLSLSNTMRVELAPFGIDVVTLVTSAVKTGYFANRTSGRISKASAYYLVKEETETRMGVMLFDNPGGHDLHAVVEATVQRLLEEPTPIFIRKGYLATFFSWFFWFLPASNLDSRAIEESPLGLLKRRLNGETPKAK